MVSASPIRLRSGSLQPMKEVPRGTSVSPWRRRMSVPLGLPPAVRRFHHGRCFWSSRMRSLETRDEHRSARASCSKFVVKIRPSGGQYCGGRAVTIGGEMNAGEAVKASMMMRETE